VIFACLRLASLRDRRAPRGADTPAATRAAPGIYHQFLWTASQPFQYCDKGAVRRDANRNRGRVESGPGPVSGPALMQLPRGFWLLLYDQDAAQHSGGSTPPKGPARKAGRERDAVRRGAGESGKARKTS
jgi:hypothetical protein